MWDCFILSWTRAAHSSCTILSFPFTFETLFKMGKQKFFFQMHSWKLEHLTLRQFERKRIQKKEEKSCWKRSKLASEISASLPADSCLTIVPEIFHWNPREVTECPFIENIVLFLTEILALDLSIALGCDFILDVIWTVKETWPSWRDLGDWSEESFCVRCQSKQPAPRPRFTQLLPQFKGFYIHSFAGNF